MLLPLIELCKCKLQRDELPYIGGITRLGLRKNLEERMSHT